MLSIKSSLCSILMLATYAAAAAPGQSAINLKVEACSKENTGTGNAQGENIYQTFGLCNDQCQGKFTYAVLQWQNCWCTNEKPSETVSVDECNQSCPGYPDDKCGNKGAGLFSYVPLDGAPVSGSSANSSTSAAGSASSASNSTASVGTSSSSAAGNSSSGATDSSSASENGNSTSSSDPASASYTGDSNTLSASLALSAILGLAVTFAF